MQSQPPSSGSLSRAAGCWHGWLFVEKLEAYWIGVIAPLVLLYVYVCALLFDQVYDLILAFDPQNLVGFKFDYTVEGMLKCMLGPSIGYADLSQQY
jgi:hypothetical protein